MDYIELARALRCKRDDCEGCDLAFFDKDEGWMCRYAAKDDDAADAIEELQAHFEKSTKSADAYRTMYFTKHGDITIEKVRELDEKDYYFHSALIRLMYRRIVELEAQLPKRGEWIRIDKHTIQCPLCHRYLDLHGVNAGRGDANYCPNCGAKMDGERKEGRE